MYYFCFLTQITSAIVLYYDVLLCHVQLTRHLTNLSIISLGPWSIPTMSLSRETASKNASSQNCIWSQRFDLSLPSNPSNKYVLPPSGEGVPEVLIIFPPWYLKPALRLDLLLQTDGFLCFFCRWNWKLFKTATLYW